MARTSGRSRGCEPCRQKKIKCDERQPQCSQCLRHGRKCPGPVNGLIVLEADFTNPKKFRRVPSDSGQFAKARSSDTKEVYLVPSASPESDKALALATLDPFSSMAVPITHRTNTHFKHFMAHTVNCCWPFRPEMLGIWCREQATIQPAIFYGILSMSASHRFHLDNVHETNNPDANQWMIQALEFRAKAIFGIQQTVNSITISDIKLAAVMVALLICAEATNANISEMDIHMAGLEQLLHHVGGLDSLDLSTISFMLGVDILWAIVRCAQPALPLPSKYLLHVLEHPALTVLPCDVSEIDLLRLTKISPFPGLGARFVQSPWAANLDGPLKVTIWNFCNLIIHYEIDNVKPEHEKNVAYGDNDPWNLSQRYLLTLSYEQFGPRDIREPLRRSMLAYSMTRYCKFGAFPCVDVIAGTLIESLAPRLETFYSTAPDLLFWILYVGALTARQTSGHYRWYCTQLVSVSSAIGLVDWSDVISILQQFFYIHRPTDVSFQKIWQNVLCQIASG